MQQVLWETVFEKQFNEVLNNTNNKFDPIKNEIKLSTTEVTGKYLKNGYDLKSDLRFKNSLLFNTKTYEFIGNLSKILKIYFFKERERYSNDVDPFSGAKDLRRQKAEEYFQCLTREKMNDIIPKKNRFNWITKQNAILPKETTLKLWSLLVRYSLYLSHRPSS